MSSIAVEQIAIEDALVAKYSGIFVNVNGVPTGVRVFLEEPSSFVEGERIYPSITISFVTMREAVEMREAEYEMEEVGYDDSLPVHVREMREMPQPIAIVYSVDTWFQGRAQGDRDMMREVFVKRTRMRDSLPVKTIDGNDVTALLFWDGNVVKNDEMLPDEVIYHKTATIRVEANLAVTAVDDTESVEVVMVSQIDVDGYSLESDGTLRDQELDVKLKISENGVEVSKN